MRSISDLLLYSYPARGRRHHKGRNANERGRRRPFMPAVPRDRISSIPGSEWNMANRRVGRAGTVRSMVDESHRRVGRA